MIAGSVREVDTDHDGGRLAGADGKRSHDQFGIARLDIVARFKSQQPYDDARCAGRALAVDNKVVLDIGLNARASGGRPPCRPDAHRICHVGRNHAIRGANALLQQAQQSITNSS